MVGFKQIIGYFFKFTLTKMLVSSTSLFHEYIVQKIVAPCIMRTLVVF